jgi:hypothetical protein
MKTNMLWRLFVAAIVVLPISAFAQNDKPVQGYLFGTVAQFGFESGQKVGGGIGVERVFNIGLGVGGEVQGFGLTATGDRGAGVLVGFNGSYHFPLSERRRWVPFVTLGYSGLAVCSYGCGGASGFNYGGGVNYWLKPNRGIRVEFRDHVFPSYGAVHQPEFRIGFSF